MPEQAERYEILLEEFYGQPVKTTRTGGLREITLDCSVGRDQGRYLYEVVRQAHSREVLEIGMAWGGSSVHISAALEANGNGRLTVIDPYQMSVYSGIAMAELERLKVAVDVTLIETKSDLALPLLLENKRDFDFVFIDGDHRFDGAFVDFHYSHQLVRIGGHIIFDDAQAIPVRKVISFINANLPNLRFIGIKGDGRFAHFIKEGADNRADGASQDF